MASAAVVELDNHSPVLLRERLRRYTQPNWHGITVECQDFVQVGTVEGEAGAHVAPHGSYIDVGQQVAAVVAHALVWDQCRAFDHGGFEVKGTQRPRGVAWEVDSGSGRRPGGLPLNHFRGEPALSECSSGTETRNPGADHENAQAGTVVAPGAVSHRMSFVTLSSATLRLDRPPLGA